MKPARYFDRAYFDWQAASAERSARVVVPALLARTGAETVVDLGCGTGAWLQVFLELGAREVLGVDGPHVDRAQLRIPQKSFLAHDLSRPLELDRRFDLALSLEAAHYLPQERAAPFVALLTELAPVVLFSAAIPHQPGGPTLNRQWPEYWARLFALRGFRAWDWLRREIWNDGRVDWWYAQNAILFVDEAHVEATDVDSADPLPLVHPGLFLELVGREKRRLRRRVLDGARAAR